MEVARLLAASALVRLAYVVPTYHNPTGATMPEGRRRELATAAAELGFHVVEDLTPDTSLGLDVPRPIASFDEADRVITLGSLSKIAWGGLRIGWIRTPRADIDRLVAGKIVADHATSLITQAIAARVLDRVDDVVSWARAAAAERRTVITEALAAKLPDWEVDRARRRSIAVGRSAGRRRGPVQPAGGATRRDRPAGAVGFARRGFRDHIRIAYGAEPDRLVEAVDRLAGAWAEYAPANRRYPRASWPSASNPAPRRIGLAIVAAPPWGSARPAPPPAG